MEVDPITQLCDELGEITVRARYYDDFPQTREKFLQHLEVLRNISERICLYVAECEEE